MKPNCTAITKYLESYAEPDIRNLSFSFTDSFESILVIPVYDEPVSQLDNIIQTFNKRSLLLIYVFNAPDVENLDSRVYVENTEALRRTIEARDVLVEQTSAEWQDGYFCSKISSTMSLVILDYCRDGKKLPAKQGVGLARKLGMDFALKAAYQQFMSDGKEIPWLHSSDADVSFPDDYFDISANEENASALVYPFNHITEPGLERAMELYDYSLRYYVEQLEEAGSPYAFHTIGSLIAVNPLAYVSVRGFPKRSAGEDFYLLNKLAKVGSVCTLEEPVISLAGRPSHRVPFGTGPALVKILAMDDPDNTYTFYNPSCFSALKTLLAIISQPGQSFSSVELLFQEIRDRMKNSEAEAVIRALLNLKIDKQFSHLSQKRDHESFLKAFHTWFDAFITLRFVHELRDNIYPNVCIDELG